MRRHLRPTLVGAISLVILLWGRPAFAGSESTTTDVRPGVKYTHRVDTPPDLPQDIHILEIDLNNPAISFQTGLGKGVAVGRETIPTQADRIENSLAAVNADFSGFTGSTQAPQNICVQNGDLITTPNFRTAIGISQYNETRIGFWNSTSPPAFSWQGFVRDEQGNKHGVIQQNQDLNPGWLCVNTYHYAESHLSRGGEFEDEVEALIEQDGTVISIHDNGDGIPIPENAWVLIGRTTAGQWILENLTVGEKVVYGRNTAPDWREYPTLVGAGPRIVANGEYHSDPIQPFNGADLIENFTLEYKNTYYNSRHPRTSIGVNEAGDTMYWVVVDGRQEGKSGLTHEELADLMIGLGCEDAISMDGGGSSILYLDGEVKNSPSDGSPRPVTNSLVLVYNPVASPRTKPINLALSSMTQVSSSFSPDFDGAAATDGVSSPQSKWTTAQGALPPHYLAVDLGEDREVVGFNVRHAGEGGEAVYFNATEFRIESGVSMDGPWTTLATIENSTPDNVSRVRLENPTQLRYARLFITDPGEDNFARIDEFEILGTPPPKPDLGVGLNSNQPIDTNTGAILPNSDAELMGDTGAEWVRVNFVLGPWTSPDDATERGPQNLTWFETYDRIVNDYLAEGVQVYGLIGNESVRLPDEVMDPRTFTQ
ncbi:MAG: phosphodiester glycosidase family protein, partial [Candidatus Omnitrophica bacterium]|nr:phosphodiester glycosidase family protein [Candidatus Omnitrophota bacterium]